LHVAASFVAMLIAVWVVPAGSTPVGCPLVMTGAVASIGAATLKAIVWLDELALPA
jgi:hypothetical protein